MGSKNAAGINRPQYPATAIAPRSACGSKTRYPFNQMEVGDSFIVAADRVHSVRVIIGRRKDARRYVVGHDGNAYRCWRTA